MPLPIQPNPFDQSIPDETGRVFSFDAEHTPHAALGGDTALLKLVTTFYDTMDRDPRFADIRALHKPDLSEARQKLYEFLSGWLGGPPLYVEKYGHPRLRGRHLPFTIGVPQRDLWLACMADAQDACEVTGEIREFLDARFAHVANFMRNDEEG